MTVTRPLKLTLLDWFTRPDGDSLIEWFEVTNNPENPADGTRLAPFTGELWIEQDDLREVSPPKYFRLPPGREVRLRGSYLVTARDVVKDKTGSIVEVRCSFDPESRGGAPTDGRKVKSTMRWVLAPHALDVTVVLYDRLFTAEAPGERTGEALDDLNPAPHELFTDVEMKLTLVDVAPEGVAQLERLGYFAADDHAPLLFHRTVGLRDEWVNIQKRG